MIAYSNTGTDEIWLVDDTEEGVKIPKWCYNKEDYHLVDKPPKEILDLINKNKIRYEINRLTKNIQTLADYWSTEIKNYVSNKKLTQEQIERYEYKYEMALECKNKDNYDVFKAEAANTGLEPNKLADIIIEYHDKWLNTIKLNSMRIEYFRVAFNKLVLGITTLEEANLLSYKLDYAKDNFSLKTTDDEVTALINLDKIPE
jgi:hypothetical protein